MAQLRSDLRGGEPVRMRCAVPARRSRAGVAGTRIRAKDRDLRVPNPFYIHP